MTAPQGERISALERGLADHEKACMERLGEIKKTAADTQKSVEGLKTRMLGAAGALLFWALAQVWATVQTHQAEPPTQTVDVRAAR